VLNNFNRDLQAYLREVICWQIQLYCTPGQAFQSYISSPGEHIAKAFIIVTVSHLMDMYGSTASYIGERTVGIRVI